MVTAAFMGRNFSLLLPGWRSRHGGSDVSSGDRCRRAPGERPEHEPAVSHEGQLCPTGRESRGPGVVSDLLRLLDLREEALLEEPEPLAGAFAAFLVARLGGPSSDER